MLIACISFLFFFVLNIFNVALQFHRANQQDSARDICCRDRGMYVEHVFSWISCYHGMHIVQKASSGMFRSGNMNYSKVYGSGIRIFTLQEWGITDSATYITYVVLLISFTFNIFIFCYIGELVAEQV
jgi:hypothetical protein